MNESTPKSPAWRIVASILTFAVVNSLLAAETARLQFENSDVSYLTATYGVGFAGRVAIPGLLLAAFLVWLWFAAARRLIASSNAVQPRMDQSY